MARDPDKKKISFPSLVNSIIYDLVPKGVQMGGQIFWVSKYIYISQKYDHPNLVQILELQF